MTDQVNIQLKPVPHFDRDNVIGLLHAAIIRRGGMSNSYTSHVNNVLADVPAMVREKIAHSCMYVTPTNLTFDLAYVDNDTRLRQETTYVPLPREIKPLCLIGCVLVDAGVPYEAFKMIDMSRGETYQVNSSSCATALPMLEEKGYITITDQARDLLRTAQSVQDDHRPWGEAFERTLEHHAEIIRQQSVTT